MFVRTCCLGICCTFVGATSLRAELRQWSSSDGKFKVDAEFIGSDGREATLRKKGGETIVVPLTRLSESDRRYVDDRKGDESKGELSVAAPFESIKLFKKMLDDFEGGRSKTPRIAYR